MQLVMNIVPVNDKLELEAKVLPNEIDQVKIGQKATEQMIEGAQRLQALQEAGQRAAEANMTAMQQWMKLWGWK